MPGLANARCRFCSVNCEEYCEALGLPEDCDCVQCPDGLELPPLSPLSSMEERGKSGGVNDVEGGESCADAEHGDAFCMDQVGARFVFFLFCFFVLFVALVLFLLGIARFVFRLRSAWCSCSYLLFNVLCVSCLDQVGSAVRGCGADCVVHVWRYPDDRQLTLLMFQQ